MIFGRFFGLLFSAPENQPKMSSKKSFKNLSEKFLDSETPPEKKIQKFMSVVRTTILILICRTSSQLAGSPRAKKTTSAILTNRPIDEYCNKHFGEYV